MIPTWIDSHGDDNTGMTGERPAAGVPSHDTRAANPPMRMMRALRSHLRRSESPRAIMRRMSEVTAVASPPLVIGTVRPIIHRSPKRADCHARAIIMPGAMNSLKGRNLPVVAESKAMMPRERMAIKATLPIGTL